jgi:hypothetical protein
VYPELLEELQKLVASPLITENEFPATFLRSFAASGIETKLKNHVFHLMRSKCVEKWIQVCHILSSLLKTSVGIYKERRTL